MAGTDPRRHPLLRREWHRNRHSRLARALGSFLLAIAWALAAWGTYEVISVGVTEGADALEISLAFWLMFGLLLLSAAAPTALAEERARGSLDVLMTTPVATREIVMAKWWGMFRRVLVMLPLFVYVAAFLAATAVPLVPTGVPGVRINYLYGITVPRSQPLAIDIVASRFLARADFLALGHGRSW